MINKEKCLECGQQGVKWVGSDRKRMISHKCSFCGTEHKMTVTDRLLSIEKYVPCRKISTIILSLLLIVGCSKPEIIMPDCSDKAEVELVGEKLKIRITESVNDRVVLRRQGYTDLVIVRHYFNCVSVSIDHGVDYVLVDGDSECLLWPKEYK